MRIKPAEIDFLKENAHAIDPKARVYLFGSRIDDESKGGDIDIFILADEEAHYHRIYLMKERFYEQFGRQKLDIIWHLKKINSPFQQHVLNHAILL